MLGLHCISGSTYWLGYGRSHYDSLRVEELSLEGSVFINMDKIRINGKHTKRINYKSMNHVSSTSKTEERLFSRAKLVMTSQRRCMDPSTLEPILMLRCNHDLWDIFFIDRLVLKNEASADASLVDNPDDEELEDPDGGEEERMKVRSSKMRLNFLNVSPRIHFLSIMVDAFAGRVSYRRKILNNLNQFKFTSQQSWLIYLR